MSEKEEDHIPIKVKDAEIIEQKPPNDKIIEFKIDYSDSIICPECNTKNLKKALFCSECGKRFQK